MPWPWHIYLELFLLRCEFLSLGQVKKLNSVFTCSALFTCQCGCLLCMWVAIWEEGGMCVYLCVRV